jgi:formylglycine-generating enzyme required for sulfatase activity
VTYLLWTEAAAFANAVSADAGLDACYTCIGTVYCALDGDPYACEGYRLPTEAEFEKAARCGADTLYAGSSDLSAVAWTERSASGGVGTLPAGVSRMPVAQRAANACGLFDLSGNAGEFSTDMWGPGRPDGRGAAEVDPYRASGPTGPAARGVYLTQGNSEPAARITASEATGYFSGNLSYTLGFRLVRSVPR